MRNSWRIFFDIILNDKKNIKDDVAIYEEQPKIQISSFETVSKISQEIIKTIPYVLSLVFIIHILMLLLPSTKFSV